jgi:hypothetical protein
MRSVGMIEMNEIKKLNFIEVNKCNKNNLLLINKYGKILFQLLLCSLYTDFLLTIIKPDAEVR